MAFKGMGAIHLPSWPGVDVHASADPDDSVLLATAVAAEPI
jgi:hypothetical protein